MPNELPVALATIRQATARAGAVRCFLDVLESHSAHIADCRRRAEQIYRFQTPDRPWFQWDVTGFHYERSAWVQSQLDGLLDGNMQSIVYRLETMPESDFVPLLGTGIGASDLIPRLFGVTFDTTKEGAVLQHFNLIEELPRDLARLRDVDVTKSEAWRDVCRRVQFLAETVGDALPIAYPQMQGPDTNAARLMDQAEMLMAIITNPDDMRVAANVWAETSASLILELQRIAGGPDRLRPRQRFYQPDWITGLVVGDYLTVVEQHKFYAVFASAFEIMQRRVGPLFYHTCGPIMHTLDVLKALPGLVGLECGFVRGTTKTTADLAAAKGFFAGSQVLCSFEHPTSGLMDDRENVTAAWLRQMSEGGGFMMQASGPVDEGRELFKRLEL